MLFHKIYMLSNQTGKCVYDGPPEDVVNQLDRVRLKCPEYYNPADFLVEIASGDKGIPVLKQLSKEQEHCFKEQAKQWTNVSSQSLLTIVAKQPRFPIFKHSWLLYQRSMTISFRDLWLFGLRLTMHVFNALFMGLLFGDSGDEDGCPVQLKTNFDIDELEDIQASVVRRDKDLYYNSGCIFFTVMFLMFAGMMPSVLTFPSELNILIKERFNQWYSVSYSINLSCLFFNSLFSGYRLLSCENIGRYSIHCCVSSALRVDSLFYQRRRRRILATRFIHWRSSIDRKCGIKSGDAHQCSFG